MVLSTAWKSIWKRVLRFRGVHTMRNIILHLLVLTVLLACDPLENGETIEGTNNTDNTGNVSNTGNTGNVNNTDNTGNVNNQTVDPAWFEPDPEGRVTEGNLLGFTPSMLVITSPSLAENWETYAAIRTILGRPTAVVTMEEISQRTEGRDDAERLRNYLKEAVDARGISFALLGGDREHVPFRRVENAIFLDTEYTSHAPSQSYFSNLEADFDSDGDGVFGEYEDLSLETLRAATLPVGRVPSGTTQEVADYGDKVIRYITGFGSRQTHTLLLSDIATSLPLIGDVDGAEGVEITYDALFSLPFTSRTKKHYATQYACDSYGATMADPGVIGQSMEEGYAMVFHNGHGSHGWLTDILSSAFVENLTNQVPSILVSCACLAGNFADVADSSLAEEWEEQEPDEDSAGEKFINGPFGGVAYVGNTATGLGAFGGSQFIHALYDGFFTFGLDTIGEAFNFGRSHMREADWSIPVLPMEMTDDSEWWTQHAVILLGDPSLEIHRDRLEPLFIAAPKSYGPGYGEVMVTVTDSTGAPVEGATVELFKVGDFYLTAITGSDGAARFTFIPNGPEPLHVGARILTHLPAYARIEPAT